MTTHSGATYKPMKQQRDSHAEGGAAEGRATTSTALPEISQLTEMVRVMMEERESREREIAEDQERRDRQFAEDRERRDQELAQERKRLALERQRMDQQREDDRRRFAEESERRLHNVRLQMEHLQSLIAGHSTTTPPARAANTESIKLTKLGEDNDVEAYLTTFERIMEVNIVNREPWPF